MNSAKITGTVMGIIFGIVICLLVGWTVYTFMEIGEIMEERRNVCESEGLSYVSTEHITEGMVINCYDIDEDLNFHEKKFFKEGGEVK